MSLNFSRVARKVLLTVGALMLVSSSCRDSAPTSPTLSANGKASLDHEPGHLGAGPYESRMDITLVITDMLVAAEQFGAPFPPPIPNGGGVDPRVGLTARIHVQSTANGSGLAGWIDAVLLDMNGNRVREWSERSSDRGVLDVSWITDLPAGMWMLSAVFRETTQSNPDGTTTTHTSSGNSAHYVVLSGPPPVIEKDSRIEVPIYFLNGVGITPSGVPPGTPLVARVRVFAPDGGEGIPGPVTLRLVDGAGQIINSWPFNTPDHGQFDVGFTAGVAGPYKMVAEFAGATLPRFDGATYTYRPSLGSTAFQVTAPQPVTKGSVTNVSIFFDNGPLPPPGQGGLGTPIPLSGVAPGTNLVARIHVGVPNAEGIEGPVLIRLLNSAGAEVSSWPTTTSMQGHVDIRFTAGPVGPYTLTAQFAGSSRTGPDNVTTNYLPSFGQRGFLVAVANQPPIARISGPNPLVVPRTSSAGAGVTLNGSTSSDPEGGSLQYAWFKVTTSPPPTPPVEVQLGTGSTLTHQFPLGNHLVKLRVTDNGGTWSDAFVSVDVRNVQPVAVISGPNPLVVFRTTSAGANVNLSGASSSDPDGQVVEYAWYKGTPVPPPATPVEVLLPETGSTLTHTFPLGNHYVRLRVKDNNGMFRDTFVSITVKNVAPTAFAGGPQTFECTRPGVVAQLSGSGSDLDGSIISYRWTGPFGPDYPMGKVGQEVSTGPLMIPGTNQSWSHSFALQATDNDGGVSALSHVQIIVADTKAPVIGGTALASELWPPNHQMVLVATGASATDACDPAPALAITVTSNEPTSGIDAEDLSPDWDVVQRSDGKFDVYVRAERGNDRIYTITATATDRAGNSSTEQHIVRVPKNRNK